MFIQLAKIGKAGKCWWEFGEERIFHTAGEMVGISIPETSLLLYNPEILFQKINYREIILVQVYKETSMRMLMKGMFED